MSSLAELELANYSKFRAILGIALPACLQNAAQPATTALQTALLGRYAETSTLAAFAAVFVSASFISRVFNFLVDGVSAKVGRAAGERAWAVLAFRVRLALTWALGAGVMAAALLAALKAPITEKLLDLKGEVLAEAEPYYWLRTALVPVQLMNLSISGILQGFHRVRASALLNTAQALLELAGSAAVLMLGLPLLGARGLAAVGWVSLSTQLLASLAGLACVLLLPPRVASGAGAGAPSRLLDAWSARQAGGRGPAGAPPSDSLAAWRWLGGAERRAPGGCDAGEPLLGGARGRGDGGCVAAGSQSAAGPAAAGGKQQGGPPAGSPQGAGPAGGASSAWAGGSGAPSDSTALVRGGGSLGGGSVSAPAGAEWASCSAVGAAGDDGAPAHTCGAVGREGPAVRQELGAAQQKEHTLDFVRDGLNMLVRSLVLHATFFASLVAASRLGTANLAAHSIVGQLWNLSSYVVDGFAAAGIVLGSRLFAHARDPATAPKAARQLRRLIHRALAAGLLTGCAASVLFGACWRQLMGFFTRDAAIVAVLSSGPWLLLVLMQPVNGLVFVYDGLVYASQSFSYLRNMMLLGLLLAFTPLLLLELLRTRALWGVWLANAAVNVWRLGGAAWLVHGRFMREFGSAGPQAAAGAV